jgi:hypothetical protein
MIDGEMTTRDEKGLPRVARDEKVRWEFERYMSRSQKFFDF